MSKYSDEVNKDGAIPPVPIRLCTLYLKHRGKHFTAPINFRLYVTLLNELINRGA